MSDDNEQDKDTSVRVAVRIRPQIPREIIDMCRVCTHVTPDEPQVQLGADKAFTYDYVFDTGSSQTEIYNSCVEKLINGALKGYNATVLAYGQTGSGKTYTMGTGFERDFQEHQEGIIPRAVRHLFSGIDAIKTGEDTDNGLDPNQIQFSVAAQFMELYNEDIIDLLDPYSKGKIYKIHEDPICGITVSGATIIPISGPQDALRCLQQGALARTTASTQMNAQSSRSHALFTILIRRQRIMSAEESGLPEGDLETLTSKFHFVDLAGSERLKRTGATGDRAREGISINCGLLALGNVISALGDKSKRVSHIPYRDSKLTRLLQDSLGGNSQTVMVACVSPSDRDFMETLNTLKYANRARNIKNRVQINQDQSSRTISQLRREIAALQLELLEYRQGKRSVDSDGNPSITDTFHENSMLMQDNKRLQQRLKAMQESINSLTESNAELMTEKALAGWTITDSDRAVSEMVAGYLKEIEKLKAKLIESDQLYQQLKKSANMKNMKQSNKFFVDDGADDVLALAKKEIERERELLMTKSLPGLDDNNLQSSNEQNESDSESDTESDDKTGEMQAELNDISSDIELKSKLIEQLELSQQRMQIMRQHYEEKLNVLSAKIMDTQKERDKVLGNINSSGNQTNDKVKKVKEEYERKISDMQRELRKLQQAQKEHMRQQKELQSQESQLRQLRSELTDLKANKVKLIRKMNEETKRHNEAESKRNREIAQLRKESRKHMSQIKSLQAQGAAKDQVLKRKTEQVSALKKIQRGGLSIKASGRIPNKQMNNANFNSRQARLKYDSLQRTISRAARSKQAVVELERELERLLHERDSLSKDLTLIRKRQQMQPNQELASEEDSLIANLNYIQENITEVQNSIMELEEGKEASIGQATIQNLLENINTVDEAKYFIERLCGAAIVQSCDVAITETRLVEQEALLSAVQQDSNMQQELLNHVLSQAPAKTITENLNLNSNLLKNNLSASNTSLNSNSTYDIPQSALDNLDINNGNSPHSSRSPSPSVEQDQKTTKVRRLRAQPQDLLFGNDDSMTRSYNQAYDSSSNSFNSRSMIPLTRIPSAPGSLKGLQPLVTNRSTVSPLFPRKSFDPITAPVSPRVVRRQFSNKTSPGLDDNELPPSPPVYRRTISKEDQTSDVFSRLGAGIQDPAPGGCIRDSNTKLRGNQPLHCTHIVDGHTNSVLSVKIHDNTLFTGAADRTVKIWDLVTGSIKQCLASHPGPVIAVQYEEKRSLLYSASGAFVRAWDLRTSNSKAVKTLCSSGSVLSGTPTLSLMQSGECPITALCTGPSGSLYTAASDKVRIWDIRNFSCTGKLSGGHQAAVMCAVAWEGPNNTDFVATGSKDHYVKVFEVPTVSGLVLPLLHLEPPHYDGVQAMAVGSGAVGVDVELFSGSRDTGIKKWDLRNGELRQSLNNAHKGWVSGMAICGDVLLSGCRGGVIKFWNIKNCDALAEMKTDTAINDIAVHEQRVFTASNSGEVRIWRLMQPEIISLVTNPAPKTRNIAEDVAMRD